MTQWKFNINSIFLGEGVAARDSGNDFFVSQISDGSVTFPGTRIVG